MDIQNYLECEARFSNNLSLEPVDYNVYVSDLQIWIRVQVIGKGSPILFLHGSLSSGSIFYPIFPCLSEYSCIAIDRFGCGLSTEINIDVFSKKNFEAIGSAMVKSVCDFFKYKSLDVVASSFGGYLVLLSALSRLKQVNKIILLGCPALIEGMKVPFFMKAISSRAGKWLLPKIPNNRISIRNIMKQLGHGHALKKGLVSDHFVAWYASLFNDTLTQGNELGDLGKILKGGKMKVSLVVELHHIKVIENPILLLWGTNDPFGPWELAMRLAQNLGDAQLVPIKNAGHLPWIDDPQNIALKISYFLTK